MHTMITKRRKDSLREGRGEALALWGPLLGKRETRLGGREGGEPPRDEHESASP